jgi:flagellar basal-body rod protein FlgB
MSNVVGGIFNFADRLQMASLDQRLKRGEVITANIANAETPGFRALGYDFEDQLATLANLDGRLRMQTDDDRHYRNAFTTHGGKIEPDVFVEPTESVGEDGNTVDVDAQMSKMAENQILYRSAVEMLNRKVGVLKYAINGGR